MARLVKKNKSSKVSTEPIEPRGEMLLQQPLVEEMQTSYLDYAMSVIVARALPDVRDGLKPVHRRVLYAMWNIGLRPSGKFRKSATVVGEVMGKYHPHGDSAIYESMVRMAQDFSMRYELVNGQGNFGSMDGDGAAAMRYTEAKLRPLAEDLLLDIEKNTVDFAPNYDGSQVEPTVLPAKAPNLLLNGSVGIAVGMATSIPPHNLTEVVDAIMYLTEHPDCDVDDLMEFVKGPDFPTGGVIYNWNDIKATYSTGKGGIVIRGEAEIEETKEGQFRIIVTSIPYQVNKSTLVEAIANLVREKKVEGIKDLRDESDRDGVRIVVELKKDAYPKKVLNNLYKFTQLQETFHANLLALVDGLQPRVLTLKNFLEEYLKHRRVVIRRRTEFDLEKARDRAHILEGLVMALDKIDAVIKTIRASKDKEIAKANLISHFKLSDRQATAILEMRLQSLANLERLKIEGELKEKLALIKELMDILKSEKRITGIIVDELKYLKDKYGDERKTRVVKGGVGEMTAEDLIPNEPAVITITHDGYIKRLPPDTFKTQSRGGKGVIGLTTKEEDEVEHFMGTNTHDDLMFFTTRGRVFQLKAYDVPPASRTAKGTNIVNFLQLGPEEMVSSILQSADFSLYKYMVMVTEHGLIKRVGIDKFSNIRRSGLIALKLKDGDKLQWVKLSTGKDDIILVSAKGQAIRFKEKDIREMGRNAAGVRGMRLKGNDLIVGMDLLPEGQIQVGEQLLVVMSKGYGKRTPVKEYKVQGRGGSGIKTANVTAKTGEIKAVRIISSKHDGDAIIMSKMGQVIRMPIKSVSILGRATQGVRLMRFKEEEDELTSLVLI